MILFYNTIRNRLDSRGVQRGLEEEIRKLVSLHEADPGSQLAHVTMGFNHARFGSLNNGLSEAQQFEKINEISPELFRRYRGWYIQTVEHAIHDYSRPAVCRHEPRVVASLDDQQDEACRLHIHSLMLIPSRHEAKISTRLDLEGRSACMRLEPKGHYHVAFISADEACVVLRCDVKSYASPLLHNDPEGCFRSVPDSHH